jgi:hypothetical protein
MTVEELGEGPKEAFERTGAETEAVQAASWFENDEFGRGVEYGQMQAADRQVWIDT